MSRSAERPGGLRLQFVRTRPENCQYHIHVFGEDLYSQYELRPDRLGQLHAHHRPSYGGTYLEAIARPEIEARIAD